MPYALKAVRLSRAWARALVPLLCLGSIAAFASREARAEPVGSGVTVAPGSIEPSFDPVIEGLAEWLRLQLSAVELDTTEGHQVRDAWPLSRREDRTQGLLDWADQASRQSLLLLDLRIRSSRNPTTGRREPRRLELALRLYDVEAHKLIAVAREAGTGEELPELSDRALERILPALAPDRVRAELPLPTLDELSAASEALALYDRGDPAAAWQALESQEAFEEIREQLRSELEDTELPLAKRVDLHRAMGQMDTAWSLLRETAGERLDALDAEPTLLASAAAVALERGELDDSERYATQALARDPGQASALDTQSRNQQMQGAMDEAAESLRRLIESDPTIDRLERMANMFPEGSEERALFRMEAADAAANRLQPGRARKAFEAMGFEASDYAPQAYDKDADLSTRLLDHERAKQSALAAIEAEGATPERLEVAGRAAFERGELEEARGSLRAALASSPDRPELRRLLGKLETEAGDLETGRAELSRALELAPDDPRILRDLAANADARGDTARARELFEEAETHATATPEELLELARVQQGLGDDAAAVATLERALELAPGNPEVLAALEREHARLGNEEQARAYAEEARSLATPVPSARRIASSDADSGSDVSPSHLSPLERLLRPLRISAPDTRAVYLGHIAIASGAGESAQSQSSTRALRSARDRFLSFRLRELDQHGLDAQLRSILLAQGIRAQAPVSSQGDTPEVLEPLLDFEAPRSRNTAALHRAVELLGHSEILLVRATPLASEDAQSSARGCPVNSAYRLDARLLIVRPPARARILGSKTCVAQSEALPDQLHLGTLTSLCVFLSLLIYPFVRGFGRITVVFLLPAESRPLFSVRVSRRRVHMREADIPRDDARWRIRDRLVSLHRNQRSLTEGDRVTFRRLFVRKTPYYVTMRGPLLDPASGDLIGLFNAEKRVRVKRNATARVEFDMRPRQARVEVIVRRGEHAVDDARIALAGHRDSVRFAHGQAFYLYLDPGKYTLIACGAERAVEHPFEVPDREPIQLDIDLLDPDGLVFERAEEAQGAYLEGDFEAAAKLVELAGDVAAAQRIRARNSGKALTPNDRPARARGDRSPEDPSYPDRSRANSSHAALSGAGPSDAAPSPADRSRADRSGTSPARADASIPIELDAATLAPLQLDTDSAAPASVPALPSVPPSAEPAPARARQLSASSELEDASLAPLAGSLAPASHPAPAAAPAEAPLPPGSRTSSAAPRLGARPTRAGAEQAGSEPTRAEEQRDFGRYILEAEIGRGGMGLVFRARDRVLERIVALKQLPEHLHQNELAVRYFTREAQSAAALCHPHIVILYDAGREARTYYLTMEYLEGLTLDALVRKVGPLSSRDAAQLGLQAAHALGYAHGNHIIHRDIKAANLFLTRDKKLKVMDFGLAKVVEEVRRASSAIAGTPHYMPPEQARGGIVDARADLYALGVTLFFLCTGGLPFEEGDILYHHANTRPPDPRERVSNVARPLAHLILQLLAKDPDERVQSAEEVMQRLLPLIAR